MLLWGYEGWEWVSLHVDYTTSGRCFGAQMMSHPVGRHSSNRLCRYPAFWLICAPGVQPVAWRVSWWQEHLDLEETYVFRIIAADVVSKILGHVVDATSLTCLDSHPCTHTRPESLNWCWWTRHLQEYVLYLAESRGGWLVSVQQHNPKILSRKG